MDSELLFRVALGIILCRSALIGLVHRIHAAAAGGKVSRREEGYLFAAILRLTGLALFVATLVHLIAPESVAWAAIPIPVWARWGGAITGLLATTLMNVTLSTLGKNLTDTVVPRDNATLVTRGPYRWVRHPFYTTAALLMASVTVLTANWLIGLLSVLVLTLLAIRTPKEEAKLLERFGPAYQHYMASTGRYLPRFK